MRAHCRLFAVSLAAALALGACNRSAPTAPAGSGSPIGSTATIYRGTVAASAEVLAGGLRIVAGRDSAAISLSGQFEIAVTDASVRLRLIGPDLDVPILLAATFQSDLVELQLRVERGAVVVERACSITISTGSNGVRTEARLCIG
jgi:hypothetical protein